MDEVASCLTVEAVWTWWNDYLVHRHRDYPQAWSLALRERLRGPGGRAAVRRPPRGTGRGISSNDGGHIVSRAVVILAFKADRERAKRWIDQAPVNARVELKAPKRSIPQNDRMWAMLTEVARQVDWHGLKLTPDDWKLIFLDALKQEMRLVPNINGTGFVNLGRSSSDLSKEEFGDLFLVIEAFGAQHDVVFTEPAAREAEGANNVPATAA
jgi:hypothetical protein